MDDAELSKAPQEGDSLNVESSTSPPARPSPREANQTDAQPVRSTAGPSPSEAAPAIIESAWNLPHKVLFRFLFAFFVIYIFPFPISYFPIGSDLAQLYSRYGGDAVVWFARHVLQMQGEFKRVTTGSGDTLFRYGETFTYLCLAFVATIIWSILDRRRRNYTALHKWLRLYIRMFLAAQMIEYGACKVIPVQFAAPGLSRMVEMYGESSPMGLLWTFMGSSRLYTIFCGTGELVAGLLLLVPHTTTLGALIAFAVMSNVFMLNMSYDVPVKLFSFTLLAASVILIAPDAGRLADLLVLNRRIESAPEIALFKRKTWNKIALLLQVVLGLYFTGSQLYQYAQSTSSGESDSTTKVKYHGVWTVDDYAIDGVSATPNLSTLMAWRFVVFDKPGVMYVKRLDGEPNYFKETIDEPSRVITLKRWSDAKFRKTIKVEEISPTKMTVSGDDEGDKVKMTLNKMDDSKFLLPNRGFHWVTEMPFNR